MKVRIEFELDVSDYDESQVYDYVADLTYEMRASRLLVPGTWRCEY